MSLPAASSRHFSVWLSRPGHRASAERYAVDGDSLIVLGDDRLADLREGDEVSATIYELHSGPPLVTFPVTIHEISPEAVSLGLFADVIGHRQLTMGWTEAKSSSRLLALQAR
ncbi:MAG: hypothetical protein NVS3B21_34130 [Acidimicrobiales bacterium]